VLKVVCFTGPVETQNLISFKRTPTMKNNSSRRNRVIAIATIVSISFAPSLYASDRQTTLYSFTGSTDGYSPSSGLIADAAGNLYGTTFNGGSCASLQKGCGTVFELSPSGGGAWTETVIHEFAGSGGNDGELPTGNLIFDSAGNLYGTASGGAFNEGTVFELSSSSAGWTEQVLYSFGGIANEGELPTAGLVIDSVGNLYGATILGGSGSNGTIFELSPVSGGRWTETTLHAFTGGSDGGWPYGGVQLDAAGNIYGTSSLGGITNSICSFGCGTVFRLSRASGSWNFTRLFAFGGTNGASPLSRVTFDAAGNLYGTTQLGGAKCSISLGCGVIFQLSPKSQGEWKETLLHDFTNGSDGADPRCTLIFDAAGNLYGTAPGAQATAPSTVYELSPASSGGWKFHVLYTFGLSRIVGASLLQDSSGNLFGTTDAGGIRSAGSAYELSAGK
jgi:uncharacterized repeat protein (TIGR03803 family)